MRRPAIRSAFTLVELLVVIAIIGILVALLLPAVQSAREASRRTQCVNNLKQLMLAFHNHHDAKNGFPPCRITGSGKQHGWIVELLPFMERQNLFDVFRLDANFNDAANQAAVLQPLITATCPSVPSGDRKIELYNSSGSTPLGIYGYAADYSVNHLLSGTAMTAGGLTCSPCRPVLYAGDEDNKLHPMYQILDGTSNTVLISEQAGRSDYYINGKKQTSNSGLTLKGWWCSWASYKHYQFQAYAADGTSTGTACTLNCQNGQGMYAFHVNGANAGVADGSVRYFTTQTPLRTMAMFLTRDDGMANAE